jgi:predicted nucleotidyltransferase
MIVALTDAQVEFIIVGGVSAVLHGAPIVTQDLDICYRRSPENLVRLSRALKPFHPRLRGLPPELPAFFDERSLQQGGNFTLEVDDENFDLLAEMTGLGGFEQVVASAEEMEVAGRSVKVLALRDLIRTKEKVGRPKVLAVLPLLEATLREWQADLSAPPADEEH